MPNGLGNDHMWLQLLRSDLWGKEYVTYPTSVDIYRLAPGTTDLYYLAAAEDNTTVGNLHGDLSLSLSLSVCLSLCCVSLCLSVSLSVFLSLSLSLITALLSA